MDIKELLDGGSFLLQTLHVESFPVSPIHFALYLQFLLEEAKSASSINTVFYAMNWQGFRPQLNIQQF